MAGNRKSVAQLGDKLNSYKSDLFFRVSRTELLESIVDRVRNGLLSEIVIDIIDFVFVNGLANIIIDI
jgi:hypothetical protein